MSRPRTGGKDEHPARALKQTKTILLTSYKHDGTPVSTPLSIAFDGDRAFFRSYHKAWKTKRLRNNPNVEVAAATFRSKPTGAVVPARARLTGEEARLAARALARRHRVLQGIVVPLGHRFMRYQTMPYELERTPKAASAGSGRVGLGVTVEGGGLVGRTANGLKNLARSAFSDSLSP